MKRILLLSVLFFFFMPLQVYASDYVLPYPPLMPGGALYKIRIIAEEVKRIWSFGSLAQFKYNLEQSDKYLVQAKVLFEYKQYLLGFEALQKSNEYYKNANTYIYEAKKNGKDTTKQKKILTDATEKHIDVLKVLKNTTPSEFKWSPEKSASTILRIHALINESINKRMVSK